MAIAVALAKHAGKRYSKQNILVAVEATLDNSYPTGGYPFDPVALMKDLGNYDKDPDVLFVQFEQNKGGLQFEFVRDELVPANRKLLVRDAAGAEIAATTDLSVTPGTVNGLITAQ